MSRQSSPDQRFLEFSDNYEHPDQGVDYIVENEIFIPSSEFTKSYEDLREAFNSYLSSSCICSDNDCTSDSCPHGKNYQLFVHPTTSKTEFVLNPSRNTKEFLCECSQFCKCPKSCKNRRVQFGPRDDLEIKCCEGKGMGLFTKSFIPAGAFICEYAGELLTESEARKRDVEPNPMKYLLCLNEISASANKIQTFVDPIRRGNIGRYLNHSCEPNCEILSVRVDSIIPKLGIFATKDICAGQELTFDYAGGSAQSLGEKSCLCRSENCRKFLPNTKF